MNKYMQLVNEISASIDNIRHQVYVSKKENESVKPLLAKRAEEHTKYMENLWNSFEDEIFKNITTTQIRAKSISTTEDVGKSYEDNNSKFEAEIESLACSITELRDDIAKKEALFMEDVKYMKNFVPLSEVKYKEADKHSFFIQNDLYDYVKTNTRTIWDMETSKTTLRGFTYDPVQCNFLPFSENILEQDMQVVQDILWEKLNTSCHLPIMNYGLEKNEMNK